MARTTGDILIDALVDWGVDVVFGLPGDGINGLMEVLRQRREEIRFVQVRHEEAAAFAACGYAKFTGRLGVCLATSGPGGLHLLTGLYDAKLDGVPVLAITGLQFHDLLNTNTQQDVELDKVFQDVAVYNTRVMGPAHARSAADLACRSALSRRGVAHLTIPVDVQDAPFHESDTSERNVTGHSREALARSFAPASEEALDKAAAILNEGRKTVILAGRGAIGSGDVLEQVAETLGAVIAKPLLGKAAVPDDSPYTTGGTGLLGTKPSQEAIETCDTLLIVGSAFPYLEFYPKPGQARCVQIDVNPQAIALRYPVDVPLLGDARQTLEALLPRLDRNADRGFLETAKRGMREWWALMEERGTRSDKPLKPQVVAWELGKRLRDDAVLTTDSGTVTTWYARQVRVREGQMCSVSGNLASMACGLPYAIAAQIAYPERQVVAMVGDGGLTMLMGEFANCVMYDLPVKVVVFRNNSLGQIKWEQLVMLGNPEYGCDLHPIDFAKFAEACGAKGLAVDDPADVPEILDTALSEPGPVIVDALVDPHEPPMPPKASPDQAMKLAQALARGTPDRERIVRTILADTVRELI